MPEEVKENVEEQEDAIEVSADKTKSAVLLLIILSVIVLILTPIITIVAVMTMMPKTETTAEDAVATNIKEITLEPFRTNIAGTQGTRYAQITVVLEVSSSNMEPYFQAKSPENRSGCINRVRAKINSIISDKTLNGLLSQDAKISLAKEIKDSLNDMLVDRKDAKGMITDVYFPSFLVQ
jgi:flagellar basal body-associated protein FliL